MQRKFFCLILNVHGFTFRGLCSGLLAFRVSCSWFFVVWPYIIYCILIILLYTINTLGYGAGEKKVIAIFYIYQIMYVCKLGIWGNHHPGKKSNNYQGKMAKTREKSKKNHSDPKNSHNLQDNVTNTGDLSGVFFRTKHQTPRN